MWFGDEEEAARLEASGHGQIEQGELGAALETAGELLAMGWSGGFVLEALVHRWKGEPEVAVSKLEAGTKRAPYDWRLWQLLGNLRSDLSLFDEAIEAFDRAEKCEGSSMVAVRFNRAIANRRADRPRPETWFSWRRDAKSPPLVFLAIPNLMTTLPCLIDGGCRKFHARQNNCFYFSMLLSILGPNP